VCPVFHVEQTFAGGAHTFLMPRVEQSSADIVPYNKHSMSLGLYISVPFCRTKCTYCNFASDVFSKSAYENYVARLLEDIANSRQLASELGCAFRGALGFTHDDTADSIYLGGGTPSILDAPQLLRIFDAVREQFAVTADAEITVECAPGTLTPTLIETLLQCGVNRVSLGVQSFVDQEAQSVGRLHERSTVLEEIGRLREAGLGNINVDLIAGLPHQTAESWAFSVSETIATGVPHVSVYMLEVDEDSRLGRELIAGGARYHAHFVPDDDATADFYQQACGMLASAGIAQYEISNFARVAPPNSELQSNQSRHNLKYWTRQPYLGFGVDAHSMLEPLVWGRAPSSVRVGTAERSSAPFRGHGKPGLATPVAGTETGRHQAIRFATPDSLDAYMNREPLTVTPVSVQAAIEESLFLGLRLNRGIDFESLRREFSSEFGPASLSHNSMNCHPERSEGSAVCQQSAQTRDSGGFWESAIQQSVRDGLLEQKAANLRLTARGRLLSNEVFARFLTEETKVGTGHVNPR
jgi:oxygen-independent coproporphyrinogen III oxidase